MLKRRLNMKHDASDQNAPDEPEAVLYIGEETTYELLPDRRAEDEAHGWNIGQRMRPMEGMTIFLDGETGERLEPSVSSPSPIPPQGMTDEENDAWHVAHNTSPLRQVGRHNHNHAGHQHLRVIPHNAR
jgi:hypothetical protein